MRRLEFIVCIFLSVLVFCSCDRIKKEQSSSEVVKAAETEQKPKPVQSEAAEKEGLAKLVFSIKLDRDIYELTDYGEPPQFAIWLEKPGKEEIHTVWVTYRMGSGHWIGKVNCPVALPYWVSRYNKETGTKGPPSIEKPVVDAITGATPVEDFSVSGWVEPESVWDYYVEVNVSADYNADFPYRRPDGAPDLQGNGQPSIIYKGQIKALAGECSSPELIGRTKQWESIDYMIKDVNGITSARKLLSKIEVCCQDKVLKQP